MNIRHWTTSLVAFVFGGLLPAQDPNPAKGPDKEVAECIAVLKEAIADKKFEREAEGVEAIDKLLMKSRAGLDAKDQAAIVKALAGVFKDGKARPSNKTELYVGAAQALGYLGAEGAKVLKDAYGNKQRFPVKPEWVPFREHVLKNLGRTKDESMVKFLLDEALRSPEAALAAAAGEALGNYEESRESLRKEIVSELLKKYGELAEKASQLGTNVEAQDAQNRLNTVQHRWNNALGRLARQNFTTFREWQVWYNDHKGKPW